MAAKKIRVVLDTTRYVSASINRKSRRTLYPLLINPDIRIFYSQEIMEEYLRVMQRPFFAKQISIAQVKRFVQVILPMLFKITLISKVKLSRDSNDDHVLALAIDAKAHYLITSDKDLLVLKQTGKTRIVTMSDFATLIGK